MGNPGSATDTGTSEHRMTRVIITVNGARFDSEVLLVKNLYVFSGFQTCIQTSNITCFNVRFRAQIAISLK